MLRKTLLLAACVTIAFGSASTFAATLSVPANGPVQSIGPLPPPDPWDDKSKIGPLPPPDPWDDKVKIGPLPPPDPWDDK